MQKWHMLISINLILSTNEPAHHKKERVKISNAAKFQSCRPKTREMLDI